MTIRLSIPAFTLPDANARQPLPHLAVSTLLKRSFALIMLLSSIGFSAVAADDHTQPQQAITATAANTPVILPEVLMDDVHSTMHHHTKAAPASIYQPLPKQDIQMPEPGNWLEANAKVKAIGGWMFYASEGEGDTTESTHSDSHSHHQPEKPVKEQP